VFILLQGMKAREIVAMFAAVDPEADFDLTIRAIGGAPVLSAGAARQRRYRGRHQASPSDAESVTRNASVTPSPRARSGSGITLSDQDLGNKQGKETGSGGSDLQPESVRARETGVTSDGDALRDAETVIPMNIVAQAEERGVLSDMLEHMPGVTREQLEEKAREFVTYWTIGAGAGKRRRNWMARLREDLRRAFHENRLKAPGFIEHAERSGRTMREAEAPAPKKPDPWAWQWAPGGPLFGKPRPTTGPEADPNRRTNGQKSYR
jgi:hypothetical protein